MPQKARNLEKENKEILLKEYETTRLAFNQVEGNVWQSAAIFIFLSLGGISALFSINKHDWGSFFAVASIAFISISILIIWYQAAKRWWGLEGVLLFRMREIESKLGMWANRYLQYLDTTRIYRKEYIFSDKEEKERFSELDKEIKNYGKVSARNWMRLIVSILVIGWILLTIRELVLVVISP